MERKRRVPAYAWLCMRKQHGVAYQPPCPPFSQEDLLAHDIIQPLKTVASPAASASADSGADAPAAAEEGEVATVAGSGAAVAARVQAPVAARAPAALRLLPRSRLKEAAAALEQLD